MSGSAPDWRSLPAAAACQRRRIQKRQDRNRAKHHHSEKRAHPHLGLPLSGITPYRTLGPTAL